LGLGKHTLDPKITWILSLDFGSGPKPNETQIRNLILVRVLELNFAIQKFLRSKKFKKIFLRSFEKIQKFLDPITFESQKFHTFVDFYTKMYRIKF